MKKNDGKKKNKVLAILAALLLIFALAGTYAWTSYTDWVRNHMQSLGFDEGKVTIVEEFEKDKPIKPGETIKKKVNVINASPVASFVRLSFEEQLQKLGTKADAGAGATGGAFTTDTYTEGADAHFPVIFDSKVYYFKTTWSDMSSKLTVNGTANPANSPLKLFVKGNESVLLRETNINRKQFPDHFDFKDTKFQLPMLIKGATDEADYVAKTTAAITKLASTDDNVLVAQKVSAHVVRNLAKDTYEVKTGLTGSDVAKNLAYYTYGDKVAAMNEQDWAGHNQWVKTPAKAPYDDAAIAKMFDNPANPKVVKSLADPNISWNVPAGSLLVGKGSTFDAAKVTGSIKWFFNSEDGYFYHLAPVKEGTQTTLPIIESIKFPNLGSYNLASYDLHVGSEAIPAQRSMLTAKSKKGEVTASKDEYFSKNNVTESNGSGFGLNKDHKLYEYLAAQATIDDDVVVDGGAQVTP